MAEMDEEYSDSEYEWINLEADTFCAARRPEDGKWYRAKIQRIIHKNLAEVCLPRYVLQISFHYDLQVLINV